jgi:hypothetical protein
MAEKSGLMDNKADLFVAIGAVTVVMMLIFRFRPFFSTFSWRSISC